MKTKNFPEKKRQRQLRALERIEAFQASLIQMRGDKAPLAHATIAIEALRRATEHGSERGFRTKKDRSAGGRMFRAV